MVCKGLWYRAEEGRAANRREISARHPGDDFWTEECTEPVSGPPPAPQDPLSPPGKRTCPQEWLDGFETAHYYSAFSQEPRPISGQTWGVSSAFRAPACQQEVTSRGETLVSLPDVIKKQTEDLGRENVRG